MLHRRIRVAGVSGRRYSGACPSRSGTAQHRAAIANCRTACGPMPGSAARLTGSHGTGTTRSAGHDGRASPRRGAARTGTARTAAGSWCSGWTIGAPMPGTARRGAGWRHIAPEPPGALQRPEGHRTASSGFRRMGDRRAQRDGASWRGWRGCKAALQVELCPLSPCRQLGSEAVSGRRGSAAGPQARHSRRNSLLPAAAPGISCTGPSVCRTGARGLCRSARAVTVGFCSPVADHCCRSAVGWRGPSQSAGSNNAALRYLLPEVWLTER